MQIRQGRYEDLPRLVEIERQAIEQYYVVGFEPEECLPRTEEDLRYLLKATTVLVAVDEYNQPLGYISFYPVGQYLHLEEHAVDSRWQRLGIGQRLLTYFLQAGKTIAGCKYYSLLVFKEAYWAWHCYTGMGFRELDVRQVASLQNEAIERMFEAEQRQNYSRTRKLLIKEQR